MRSGNSTREFRVREGDLVVLYHSEGVRVVAQVRRGGRVHTIKGDVPLDGLVGLEYGSVVESSLGHKFVVAPPRLEDVLSRFKRITQVIYPKDASYMIYATSVGPGSRVATAGVGSGFLAAVLAWYVRPSGLVYAYDKNREAIETSRENLAEAGLLDYVRLELRDVVIDGFTAEDLDAVFLDLDKPWALISEARRVLKHGGALAIYVPTVEQMLRCTPLLRRYDFIDVKAVEVLVREWKVRPGETRPVNWMVAHTGYMVFARKP